MGMALSSLLGPLDCNKQLRAEMKRTRAREFSAQALTSIENELHNCEKQMNEKEEVINQTSEDFEQLVLVHNAERSRVKQKFIRGKLLLLLQERNQAEEESQHVLQQTQKFLGLKNQHKRLLIAQAQEQSLNMSRKALLTMGAKAVDSAERLQQDITQLSEQLQSVEEVLAAPLKHRDVHINEQEDLQQELDEILRGTRPIRQSRPAAPRSFPVEDDDYNDEEEEDSIMQYEKEDAEEEEEEEEPAVFNDRTLQRQVNRVTSPLLSLPEEEKRQTIRSAKKVRVAA
jgi:hypothetical protein